MERFAGRYGLLRSLGRGGMGEVHLAVDLESGAEVALKRLAARDEPIEPAVLQREFEALARIRHPAVVHVVELGFDFEGTPFLVMEYVPGWAADRVVARGDWNAFAFVAARVAGGLEALHAAGVVHGDLKPGNVLVVPSPGGGRPRDVRIVDFGLAALRGRDEAGHRGTPGYAAPEVVRGDAPTPAADLYSLGATLYAIACGRAPFEDRDLASQLRRQQAAPPSALPMEEAGVPGDLQRLMLQLLAPAPLERPRDARAVRHALEALSPAARWPLAERLLGERLVGRESEQMRLEKAWRRAAKAARVVLLRGAPGTGKSALLASVAIRGALEGRSVLRVSGAESPEPGAGFRAVLRRLAAEAREELPPALAARAGADSEFDERDLVDRVEAAAGWCRVIAARGAPVAVLLDDADALDPASRRAIRRLMLTRAPALWVWTHAGEEAGDDLRALRAAEGVEWLHLAPLTEESVARLASARLQSEAPPALVAFLWQQAGGHPGWTVELLRAAAVKGALHEDDTGVRVDTVVLGSLRVEPDFETARLARWEALPPEAREVAACLAVAARPRRLGELERMLPGIRETVLIEVAAAGLATRDSEGAWALAPAALAAAIAARLPADRRRALHRAAIEAGETGPVERFQHLHAAGDADAALAVAEQAFAAGADPALAAAAAELCAADAPAEAARWLERAARAQMDRGRYDLAGPLVERALQFGDEAARRSARWGMWTTCLLRAGDFDRMAQVAGEAQREPLDDGARAVVLLNEAARLLNVVRPEEGFASADRAVELANRAGDPRTLGNALLTRGSAHETLGRHQAADADLAAARQTYVRGGLVLEELRSVTNAALSLYRLGRIEATLDLLSEAAARARTHHLRLALDGLLVAQGPALVLVGRWDEAFQVLGEAIRVGVEDGRQTMLPFAFIHLSHLEGLRGRPRAAHAAARRALALTRRRDQFVYLAGAQRGLAQAARVRGRGRVAWRWAAAAVRSAARSRNPDELLACRAELARVELLLGRRDQARRVAEAGLKTPVAPSMLPTHALLAWILACASDRDTRSLVASSQLASIEPRLASGVPPLAEAHLEMLRARVAFDAGSTRRGLESVERVLRGLDALGAVPDRAEALLELAGSGLTDPAMPPDKLGRWLEIAVGDFERLGDGPRRARALALQVELLRRRNEGAHEPGRERDLIQRVGQLLDSLADFGELTQRAMKLAVEQLDAERGVLLLMDPETGRLEPGAEHGAVDAATRREAVTYSRRVAERVAESGGSLLVRDAPTDPKVLSESVRTLRLRSILCVPMFRGGRVIGVVYLDDSRRRDAFGEADRSLLEGFAQLMAIAIENSRGAEEVRRTNEQLVGENLSLRQEVAARFQPRGIVGSSAAMARVLAMVERAAQGSSTVLLTGENGTGKEMIARVLHHSGRRRMGPFVAVNCGAIPESLLESELFGILANVATDVRAREGRFVQANGGTLFLDEIGEMPLKQQVALLSVISNREVTPVGGGKPIPVDVRIIAATNQDLRRMISEGRFREDLFYRLNVIPIEVPPLREHKADIPALARHFVEYFSGLQERRVPAMSPAFLAALMQSDWPGNVRELQNYVERIMAMTEGDALSPDPLPRDLAERGSAVKLSRKRRLADQVGELERRAILEALERAAGNQSQAARDLGMTEQAFRYRLRKYGADTARQSRRTRNNRRKP